MPFPRRLLSLALRVRDLGAALGFYRDLLGLEVEADPPRYRLFPKGRGFYLELLHDPGAPLRPYPSVGLYHFALLLPDRKALAGAFRRLLEAGAHWEGAADHGVSEALYFRDPEGNGLELYRDRPQGEWPKGPLMFTLPLNLESLLAENPKATPLPPETLLGHLHLHVGSLEAAEAFFAGKLGMAVTLRTYPGALFFAWDGYHHHLGTNTWAGKRQAPEGATGLLAYTLLDPFGREETLLDPVGARVRLTSRGDAP
ncbi:VOC family protein [Thermus brockianus]|uniref:Glyoxalase n=1 Tax=Thermus brockianus TaxID=56956 RepID=A0ABM7XKM0_THEBO|nr:VOC family protein [Thermus brockianus]BDG16871.1 glyoxalase [Thermus brockianus]